MQNLIFSLNATLPVFLVMVVGYALGQLGFLPPAFCKASDRLTFKVTLPLMLFLDMGSVDILHDFRPRFVLFCFAATLVGILTVWAGAKRFLKDKTLVGEFVQAGYQQRGHSGRGVHPEHLRQRGHGPAHDFGQCAAFQHLCGADLDAGIARAARRA